MTAPAPTPPQKVLQRVLFVAGFDGWSVIVVAGLGSLLTVLLGDWGGLAVGALVLAAGVIELRGRRRLQRRDPAGMKLLLRAQLMLLAVILTYCASRLVSFDAESAMANLTPDMEAILRENGLQRADILPMVRLGFYLTYGTVAVVSLLFQGGLAFYYHRKSAAVNAALAEPPPVNTPLA